MIDANRELNRTQLQRLGYSLDGYQTCTRCLIAVENERRNDHLKSGAINGDGTSRWASEPQNHLTSQFVWYLAYPDHRCKNPDTNRTHLSVCDAVSLNASRSTSRNLAIGALRSCGVI